MNLNFAYIFFYVECLPCEISCNYLRVILDIRWNQVFNLDPLHRRALAQVLEFVAILFDYDY